MAVFTVLLVVVACANVIVSHPSSSSSNISDDEYSRVGKKYSIKTVQSGSRYLPNSFKIGPDPSQTKSYLTITETKLIPDTMSHIKSLRKYRNSQGVHRPVTSPCVRCPSERTLIAQKRLDGVLMLEMPAVMSCSSRHPFAKSLYELQTLFGSNTEFVLPAGSHSFLSHIINVQTGKEEKTCNLRLNVMVRKCAPYRPQSSHLKVKCDRDNIWGSQCTFSCGKSGKLTHLGAVNCDDNLEWAGEEPECVFLDAGPQRRDFCILPPAPENGKFTCEINDNRTIDEKALGISDGSLCRVVCDRGFGMPANLQGYSRFYCANGHWNSTMYEFCHPKHY